MRHAVVDASLVVNFLIDERWAGGPEHSLDAYELAAPSHLDAEVMSAMRGLVRARVLAAPDALDALDRLAAAPIARVPLIDLLRPAWSRRENLSTYDALYVALAQGLGCELVTADRRIASAPGLGVPVKLITGARS